MRRSAILLASALCALAQPQPEQAHIAKTGIAGQLSLDYMAHQANCSITYGVQLDTSPDFKSADFIPAYACTDFTKAESTLTLAVRVLLTGLVSGTKYYYVAGSPDLRSPWSRVYEFTFDTGAARAGGAVNVILADFGFYNAESLEKLTADAFEGRFDGILHAGDL